MHLLWWMQPKRQVLCEEFDPIVIAPSGEDEETEDIIDDIDEVSEQLALHQIISEERHTEILERVDQCRETLEKLSQTPQTENPAIASLMTQQLAIQSELQQILTCLKELETRIPKESPPPVVIVEPSPELESPKTENPMEDPLEDSIENPSEKTPRKSRFL